MPHDLFATKGLEYLLVIGYLLLLLPFWLWLRRVERVPARAAARGWFELPAHTLLHRGHGWVRPEPGGTMRVGLDDVARRLVGSAATVELLATERLRRGEPAWLLRHGDRAVPMRAPLSGAVVEINPALAERPGLPLADPYGEGWLMRVRPRRPAAAVAGLLGGAGARQWLERLADQLALTVEPALGRVLQDGGVPVDGIARALAPEHWDEVAAEYLRTEPLPRTPR